MKVKKFSDNKYLSRGVGPLCAQVWRATGSWHINKDHAVSPPFLFSVRTRINSSNTSTCTSISNVTEDDRVIHRASDRCESGSAFRRPGVIEFEYVRPNDDSFHSWPSLDSFQTVSPGYSLKWINHVFAKLTPFQKPIDLRTTVSGTFYDTPTDIFNGIRKEVSTASKIQKKKKIRIYNAWLNCRCHASQKMSRGDGWRRGRYLDWIWTCNSLCNQVYLGRDLTCNGLTLLCCSVSVCPSLKSPMPAMSISVAFYWFWKQN